MASSPTGTVPAQSAVDPSGILPETVRRLAQSQPERIALIDTDAVIDYRELDRRVDRATAALQRDGLRPDGVVALCAANAIDYVVIMLASLRAGATFAPLAPSSTAQALGLMLDNCSARFLFADASGHAAIAAAAKRPAIQRISINGDETCPPLENWLADANTGPTPVTPNPDTIFNIIYSSGTTGVPKGIVHPNRHRWGQIAGRAATLYDSDSVVMVSTPLYSNTTLVAFLPALAAGAKLVLMPRFDAGVFLALTERHRASHAMLVPVQYRRLLDHPEFDETDLSSFRIKSCTSAPFAADLKAEVLARWPGGLYEFYGMTEGDGSCMLAAHEHPDKLHTVGQPMPGHDLRIVDDQGREIDRRQTGEIVGRSNFIMRGYRDDPKRSRETEWFEPDTGARFIRTGDIGRFDEDDFLTIVGRAKETIISGGFNIFPSDIEPVLCAHVAVADAAVFGVASERWGETPVAFVTVTDNDVTARELKAWANERLGKTQRLADLRIVDAIPRNAIGKISRNDLRQFYAEAW